MKFQKQKYILRMDFLSPITSVGIIEDPTRCPPTFDVVGVLSINNKLTFVQEYIRNI